MSNVAEAFIYTYLGLTFFYTVHKKFSLAFIVWEFIFIVIARWISIYGLGYFVRDVLQTVNFKLKNSELSIMSFCGSMRGSISFGLAISMDTPNREIIISGTLVLIFFSSVFFGAIMPRFFSHIQATEVMESEEIKPPLQPSPKVYSFKFINPNVQKET